MIPKLIDWENVHKGFQKIIAYAEKEPLAKVQRYIEI